jgi:hypothetical protein
MNVDLAALLVQLVPTGVIALIAWSFRKVTSEAKERDEGIKAALKELEAKVERVHELDLHGQRLAIVELESVRARSRLHKIEGTVAVVVSKLQERRPSGQWPRADPPHEGDE